MSKSQPTSRNQSRAAHAVRQRFRSLEHQVRRVIYVSGVCRVICLLLGGVMVYGLLDWMLHVNDPGLRGLMTASLLAGIGWIGWKWLWTPLSEQHNHSFFAALVEIRRSYLGNQLTSAAEFMEHGLDPRLGSPLLQQAAIEQAERRLDSIDLNSVIDRRSVRRQTYAAGGVFVLAVLLMVFFPTEAATAVTRILVPWSNTPWPRHVQLELIQNDLSPWRTDRAEPRQVAQGETLELYARNLKGPLPEEVVLEYRIGDDPMIREPMRKTILRDDQDQTLDVAALSFPATRGPLSVRAVGGNDDLMPFLEIEIVEPPEIATLQIHLQPPAYTRRSPIDLPPGTSDLEVLEGTLATFQATSSQPLSEAAIVLSNELRELAKLSDNASAISVEIMLSDPKLTGYRWDLVNQRGFHSRDQGSTSQIRIAPDQVPLVTLEDPVANLSATSDAVIPLRIVVKDDLGLTEVNLRYRREEQADFQTVPLKTYHNLPTEEVLTEAWSLASLELSPGDRLEFLIEAQDAYDLGPSHVGQSTSRLITIVGSEEKRGELTDRLSELLSEFTNAITGQRRVAEQTGEIAKQLHTTSQLPPEAADQFRKLELEQQRVQQELLDPRESVRAFANRLLEEFEANHLTSDETRARLETLSEKLSDLGSEKLPNLQHRLTQIQKQAAGAKPSATPQLENDLTELHTQQTETVRELDALESELSGWRDRRHIEQKLTELIDSQRALHRTTRELTQKLLTQNDTELTPRDQAEIAKLEQRQRSLAESVEQFRTQLQDTGESLADQNPEAAQQLQELSHEVEQSGVSEQLREAASSLAAGRMGQATQQQEGALHQMEEFENRLANRAPEDQGELLKQMKQLEADLEELHKAEAELAQDMQETLAKPESEEQDETLQKLAERQQELEEELAKIEQQLERLQLQRPRESVHRAREEMAQSTSEPEKSGASQQHLQDALDDLEQARRELAQARQRAEEELAFEQLLKLKDQLQVIADRQAAVRDEVQRLEDLRQSRGSFTRGQLRTLIQTAQTERDLSEQLQTFSQKLGEAAVVAITLQRLSGKMTTVSSQLDEKQTGPETQSVLQSIQDQLTRLLAVLSPEDKPKETSNPEQQPEQQNVQDAAGPQGDVVTLIAQLELLKDLQAECASRTATLEQQREAEGELSPDHAAELDSLQHDQQQLTDLAQNLLGKLLEETAPQPTTNGQTEPQPDEPSPTPDDSKSP